MDIDPGKVVIFKNAKDGVETRPDYQGELTTPGGEQLRIALWVSTSKAGTKYFSGKVQPQENGNPGQTTTEEAAEAAAVAKGDDEIPF